MRRSEAGLVAALALMALVLVTGNGRQSDGWLLVGRFHPTLVHLPIALLLLAALLEWGARRGWFARAEALTPLVLHVGAWAAVAAAIAGLLLADWGGYPVAELQWHRWLGIAIAAGAVALCIVRRRAPAGRGYAAGLVMLSGGVVIGGHLGGTLTHGSGYLTEYLPDAVRRAAGLPPRDQLANLPTAGLDTAPAYDALIQPILTRRCGACHDERRQKGGLVLATFEGVMAGGKNGKVVLPGRSDESELLARLSLPPGHKDRMPPDRSIPIAEAELLRWWIEQGAPADLKLSEMEQPASIARVLESYGLADLPSGIFTLKVAAPDSMALAAARAGGLVVRQVAAGSPFVEVDARNAPARLDLLKPLAAQVAWLDLGGAEVGDAVGPMLTSFPHLARLHLERTKVTDQLLAQLAPLSYLEYLNLHGTAITDRGLTALTSLRRLRQVFLWQTAVTAAGADTLRRAMPRLRIDLGGTIAPDSAPGAAK